MKLDELLRVIDIGENIQIEEKNDYKENEKDFWWLHDEEEEDVEDDCERTITSKY